MSRCASFRSGRCSVLIAVVLALLLLLGMLALWLNFHASDKLDGRYHSAGQVQVSNGQVQEISHNLQVDNGHFYAMTRQGDTLLETFGTVEYGFLGNYRLRVTEGQVTALSGETDDELIFNLLYGRHKGASIRLVHLGNCLYALETRQVYCPRRMQESL